MSKRYVIILWFCLVSLLMNSCKVKVNNKVNLKEIKLELFNLNKDKKQGQCYIYDRYTPLDTNLFIGIAFDIEYYSDGTQYKNYGDDVKEGSDGPGNKIETFKILLKRGSDIQNITNRLVNDSAYMYFHLGDETQFPGFGFSKQFDTCENAYLCRCEYSHIYSSPNDFVSNYNARKKTVINENLNSLFFMYPEKTLSIVEIKKYDSLIVDINFDDNTHLRKAKALK